MLLYEQGLALHDACFGLSIQHKGQLAQGDQLSEAPTTFSCLASLSLTLFLKHSSHKAA